jgi:asparagine synthase (glutamine-hydrolysing)
MECLLLLFAARDRFGEKPFYYFYNGKEFCFASELKGLWAAGISKEPNLTLFCVFLGLGYTSIPIEPQVSFYKNIFLLPAAHYITIHCINNQFDIKQVQYWDIDKQTVSSFSEQDATIHFTELFTTSLKRRLRSDVAIGTSLSGGLDSSSIAAFLTSLDIGHYKSFSALFPGYEKDESKYIDLVQQQLSIDNYSTKPTAQDFEENFQKLITIQEQPFASSSIYAQFKVFELAKQNNTTVLLDGQGADETLAGYTKYLHWYLQELYTTDKSRYKSELRAIKENHPSLQWGITNKLAALLPIAATNRLEKRAAHQLIWRSHLEQDFVSAHFSKLLIQKPFVKKLNDLLYYNSMQFGLQELLTYADKNAMANGVEVRLPFLQHELVQFVFSLPSHYKIQQGFTKYLLRKSIDKKLPDEIVWRKEKVGYETPQEDWLHSPYFKNKIEAAKKKLIDMAILQKSVANKSTDNDWRIMIAAAYL